MINKKLLLLGVIVLIIIIPSIVVGGFLGIKKNTESIVMPVQAPLNTDGVAQWPDSIQIITYGDNGTAAAYTTSSTTEPFSDIGIDTTVYNSNGQDTLLWYIATISDIDGAGGMGTLAIQVNSWYNDSSFQSFGVVQIVDVSLNDMYTWMTVGVGHKSHTDYASEEDSIASVTPDNDTLGYRIFYHPGGIAGQRPDSVKNVAKP